MAQATAPTKPATDAGGVQEAHFAPDLSERLRMFAFLDLSYVGGIRYKHGFDVMGDPILIEHEQEAYTTTGPTAAISQNTGGAGPSPDAIKVNRYGRRRRVAAYENNVRPIVDKATAYLLRTPPRRNEGSKSEHERLNLDVWIRKMVQEGLKLKESWLGFDTIRVPRDEAGNPLATTEQQMRELDPANGGKPYFVYADPRQVVDFDEDNDGNITRVVIEEEDETKAGFTAARKRLVSFKEWTATEWKIYEAVNDDGTPKNFEGNDSIHLIVNSLAVKVKEVERGFHSFGVCPWVRFEPSFPIEDVAELSRAQFNMSSLLDEEMYQNTFTQKYATGIKPAEFSKAICGPGHVLVIENEQGSFGVVGAVDGQARMLMERIEQMRAATYAIVSMDHSGTKNVAEAAEKKKRDLESLYTMLVHIAGEAEDAENRLLVAMGVVGVKDGQPDIQALSKYDTKFDVNSLSDLLDEIAKLAAVAYIPPSFKRRLAMQVIQKMEPFGDQEEYQTEQDAMVEVTDATSNALVSLKGAGLITPATAAAVLGVPEDEIDDFTSRFDSHAGDAYGGFGDPNQIGGGDGTLPQDAGTGGTGLGGAQDLGGAGGVGAAAGAVNGAGNP